MQSNTPDEALQKLKKSAVLSCRAIAPCKRKCQVSIHAMQGAEEIEVEVAGEEHDSLGLALILLRKSHHRNDQRRQTLLGVDEDVVLLQLLRDVEFHRR